MVLKLEETNNLIDRIVDNTIKEFNKEGKEINEQQQKQLRELLGFINASSLGRNDSRRTSGENRQHESVSEGNRRSQSEKRASAEEQETLKQAKDIDLKKTDNTQIDSPAFKKWFGDWQAAIDRKAGKLQGTSYTVKEAEDLIKFDIENMFEELSEEFDTPIKLVGLKIHGSRARQTAKTDSDIDVVVQYEGDVKEDTLFNALNEEPLSLDGINVDINPITEELDVYLERDKKYDKEHELKVSKLVDKDGKPQIFYRGISEKYDVGKQGEVTWISENKEQADSYASSAKDSNTLSVYANSEKHRRSNK